MAVFRKDGSKMPEGACIVPDFHVQTFVVKVRTINPLQPGDLKNVIQNKYEVVGTPVLQNIDTHCQN